MAVKTFAEYFTPDLNASDNEFHNAGSLVQYGYVARGDQEPLTYSLTPGTAAALDEEVDFYISNTADPDYPQEVFLQKGLVLYCGATNKKAIVAADTLITATSAGTAQAVPVDPLASGIAGTDVAQTWALTKLLSPTDIPLTDNDTTVDRTDLTFGLQGSTVKTAKDKSSQITLVARADDRAYYKLVYPASQGTQNLFSHITRTSGVHAWGLAKVMSLTTPGTIREIERPSFTQNFQAPFAAPTRREYLTAEQKTIWDRVMRLSGLSI